VAEGIVVNFSRVSTVGFYTQMLRPEKRADRISRLHIDRVIIVATGDEVDGRASVEGGIL
jgi:hypothetical protein